MSNYGTAIDKKWQKKWEETELYKFNPDAEGEKLYVLEMFSYPSGSQLHAGHWFNYGPVDSWARLKKMQGYNVFQPMGFDAFGLPAENFAIKTGIHPWDSTEKNIKTNVTLIFSSQQALLAAKAGATYVSPFVGRLDDIGMVGTNLIDEVSAIFKNHSIKTEIIAASIRNPIHASECALAGADIATIPFNVLKQMAKHPLTDIGIEKFLADYNK